jgi:peptidase E
MESLKRFVGGFENKKIAYIPTAANGEEGWESWKNGGTWETMHALGAEINLVILEDYRNDSVIKVLEENDIIWFAGGMPGYLMYWIKRCGIDKNIKKLLDKRIIFIGSSAGAMVAGQSLEISEYGFTDNEIGAGSIEPMKLVSFDIFPHYSDEFYDNIKQQYTGNKIYLLKDGEQILVDGDKIEVQGEERII